MLEVQFPRSNKGKIARFSWCRDSFRHQMYCYWTRTQNHMVRKRTLNHLAKLWPNGWLFVYELSGSGFESSCSHLNFRFRAYFEQRVPLHSGNYRVWIHSEIRTWHDKNIQSVCITSVLTPLCYLEIQLMRLKKPLMLLFAISPKTFQICEIGQTEIPHL